MTSLRVLVANRGEIALRVLRSLRAAGHETVAVYSRADRSAPFLRAADQAIEIGPAAPRESYLSIDRIIEAGRTSGANAVHPGYGFLSENPDFSRAVEEQGWLFLGPTPDTISTMGDKTKARQLALDAGVPVIPAAAVDVRKLSDADLEEAAKKLSFPVLLKAAAGGGGKGMRVVADASRLREELEAAAREATTAFGDGRIFLERYVEHARHVEVQVLGDGRGAAVSVGVRDCSLQRRHQKIIEETPPPGLDPSIRAALEQSAVALSERARYRGAGTVEFVLATDGEFFFLEMNTRLQVEHPVTEWVHGIDLVNAQVAIALGESLPQISAPVGHAIEARIYAESPANGFLPSIGHLAEVVWPAGPGIRVDAGVERGNDVTVDYDPLLGKIVAWGADREQAIERLRAALAETFIAGVDTTVGCCRDLLGTREFRTADLSTGFVGSWIAATKPTEQDDDGQHWDLAVEALARQLATTTGGIDGGSASAGPAPLWDTLLGFRM